MGWIRKDNIWVHLLVEVHPDPTADDGCHDIAEADIPTLHKESGTSMVDRFECKKVARCREYCGNNEEEEN